MLPSLQAEASVITWWWRGDVDEWLLTVQGQALVFNAAAEVGAGFLLLLGLLTPQRSIMLAFVYWRTFLPTRYHTPDAAGYHRQVSSFLICGTI